LVVDHSNRPEVSLKLIGERKRGSLACQCGEIGAHQPRPCQIGELEACARLPRASLNWGARGSCSLIGRALSMSTLGLTIGPFSSIWRSVSLSSHVADRHGRRLAKKEEKQKERKNKKVNI